MESERAKNDIAANIEKCRELGGVVFFFVTTELRETWRSAFTPNVVALTPMDLERVGKHPKVVFYSSYRRSWRAVGFWRFLTSQTRQRGANGKNCPFYMENNPSRWADRGECRLTSIYKRIARRYRATAPSDDAARGCDGCSVGTRATPNIRTRAPIIDPAAPRGASVSCGARSPNAGWGRPTKRPTDEHL